MVFSGYVNFGQFLNKTGRPMVYSCSWPVYQEFSGMEVKKVVSIYPFMYIVEIYFPTAEFHINF